MTALSILGFTFGLSALAATRTNTEQMKKMTEELEELKTEIAELRR